MMKVSSYVFFASLMIVALLLPANPTPAAWDGVNNSMPHFGSNSTCGDHLASSTSDPAPQTMWLCKRSSGATTWAATIAKTTWPPATVCSLSSTTVPPSGISSMGCNITTPGTYKGTITYCVGGSCSQGHADFSWTVP
jgi:hypothetical protein